MKEFWRTLHNYPKYEVSSLGRVRSKERMVPHWRGGLAKKKQKILKPVALPNGYLQVSLGTNGTNKRIHRLVAECFLSNPDNKPQVNHLDGNKKNNKVENLEWCTLSENQLHSYRTLKKKPSRLGKFGKETKINKPVLQMSYDGKIIKEWDSLSRAQREGGFDSGSICFCCQNKRKTHKGYKWKYKN